MSRDLNVDQIKKLWILDLVLQHRSLKLAALQAKVSPSAISQSLSSLEQAFGKPLLIREKGTIIPTAEALSILEVVKPAFEAFERLKDINSIPVPEIAWINFGTYESIAIDLLPGLISSLKEKLPKIKLGVRISRTSSLLTMVRKGELCSALITENDNLDRFYHKEVATDRLGIYVSKYHRNATMKVDELRQQTIGSLTPGKDGYPLYFSKFLKHHNITKPSIQSDSFETLRAAASGGAIVAVLPHRVAKRSDDLLEVTELFAKNASSTHSGIHSIIIAGQVNCDREEIDFMAEESSRLLLRKN